MKYKDILKNKELLEKEVPDDILKMLGLKKKGFEIGEKYYCINSYGKIVCDYWDNCEIDIYRLKHGNASKTEEECIFKKENQEVLAELRQFAEENNTEEIEWENRNQEQWYVSYDWSYKGLSYDYAYTYQNINDIYFTSEELAKQAVAKVGEERIKKYLFGVEV